jgi:2-phospho-L-lactate guanylyltransferase
MTQALVAAVVCAKPAAEGKSRLHGVPVPVRRRLALGFALDTIRSLLLATDLVVVVSDDGELQRRLEVAGPKVRFVEEGGRRGLNSAFRSGAATAQNLGAGIVLACVGDLPALRPASVRRVLAAAAAHQRSFVADAAGLGTTMLVANRAELDPHFENGSAAAHLLSGAVRLNPLQAPLPADAVTDVDTFEDLERVLTLRPGPATALLVDPGSRHLARYRPLLVIRPSAPGEWLLHDSNHRSYRTPAARYEGSGHWLSPGVNAHAMVSDRERVLTLWRD